MNLGAATLRTVLIVLGSSWLTLIINILRVLVVPTKLGDHGMGQVTTAASFTGFFMIFIVLGTSNYLVRAVARDNSLLDRYLSNALWLRIAVGITVLSGLVIVTNFLGYAPETQQVIIIVSLGTLIFSISNVFKSGLQAIGQMSWRSIATAIGNVLTTVIGLSLLFAGADAVTYAICIPIGMVVQLSLVLGYYFRKRPVHLSIDFSIMRALLVGGMPLFFWAFLQTTYGQVDGVMLSLIANERVMGWFGVAVQLVGVLMMIPIAINSVSLPVLCELHAKSAEQFRNFATRSMSTALVVLAPLGIGLALSSDDVIRLLHYPEPFMNSAPILSLLALLLPISGVLMIMSSLAMAIGQEKQWVKISAFGVCVFPPLYLTLIWVFQNGMGNGGIGAALASVIGESMLIVWAWFILPSEIRIGQMLGKAAQIGGLVALMAVVVVLLKSLGAPLFVYAPVGAIIYLVGAWALKLITPGDLQLARNAVLKRRRRAEASSNA